VSDSAARGGPADVGSSPPSWASGDTTGNGKGATGNGPNGTTGGANGSIGEGNGSTGEGNGSTGGDNGSTGGDNGSIGGGDGSTGWGDGSTGRGDGSNGNRRDGRNGDGGLDGNGPLAAVDDPPGIITCARLDQAIKAGSLMQRGIVSRIVTAAGTADAPVADAADRLGTAYYAAAAAAGKPNEPDAIAAVTAAASEMSGVCADSGLKTVG
jgi:hypothetical protein